jgi:hypothetical protein
VGKRFSVNKRLGKSFIEYNFSWRLSGDDSQVAGDNFFHARAVSANARAVANEIPGRRLIGYALEAMAR